MALCARSAHITVCDVTTWSWVNLVNPWGGGGGGGGGRGGEGSAFRNNVLDFIIERSVARQDPRRSQDREYSA